MLKKITKWETEDGKVFDTQEEAEDYMFEQEKEVMSHTSTEQPEALRLARWLEHRSMGGVKPNDIAASNELRRLHARVQELEASKAQRVPLDAYKLQEIFKKLNANHDEEGWNFADLVREVEEYHGITNQKCSGVGLVGGLTHDGYVSDECPFCKGSGIDNGITQEKQG